jgi:hypothetical protein
VLSAESHKKKPQIGSPLSRRLSIKNSEPILVVAFFVLATAGALCQSQDSAADLRQRENSLELRSPDVRTWKSLPDAPSLEKACSPLSLDALGTTAITPSLQPSLTASNSGAANSATFFDKYLYPSLLKRNLRYPPSTSGSFISRATDAASRLFITRDDSGKARLNDSYFFGVLTSVVTQTAQSPYWTRSTSGAFNNFGSTIGSDAGLNVFHEFEPGIWQLIDRHTPKFVSRIERRVLPDRSLKADRSSKELFSVSSR